MKIARATSLNPIIVGVLIAALWAVLPLSALGQQGANLAIEPGKGTYGLQLFVKGSGFAPNSQVQIEAFGQTIAPQSDNTGQFMVIAYAPTDQSKFKPGAYVIKAKDAAGASAEATFTLEELVTVGRPTARAATPGASGTQPPAPLTPALTREAPGASTAPASSGDSSLVLTIMIVAGVVGLLLLAVAVFFTVLRRREPASPPPRSTSSAPVSAPRTSKPAARPPEPTATTGGETVEAAEPGPTQGETTLVMPALPKLSTRPTLQIVGGEGEGTVFSLEQKTTVIGRGEDCDIVINHPLVSRHHAKIVRVGPSYYVHDLQSTNGTMVNSQRIDQHVLQPEDELQVGVTLMLFQQAKSE
jgi:hypothetical protein